MCIPLQFDLLRIEGDSSDIHRRYNRQATGDTIVGNQQNTTAIRHPNRIIKVSAKAADSSQDFALFEFKSKVTSDIQQSFQRSAQSRHIDHNERLCCGTDTHFKAANNTFNTYQVWIHGEINSKIVELEASGLRRDTGKTIDQKCCTATSIQSKLSGLQIDQQCKYHLIQRSAECTGLHGCDNVFTDNFKNRTRLWIFHQTEEELSTQFKRVARHDDKITHSGYQIFLSGNKLQCPGRVVT